jgi:hypothetical protein
MFSMVQREAHAKRRRMFANIYSKSALQSSAAIRRLSQAIFIERLLPVIDSAARSHPTQHVRIQRYCIFGLHNRTCIRPAGWFQLCAGQEVTQPLACYKENHDGDSILDLGISSLSLFAFKTKVY